MEALIQLTVSGLLAGVAYGILAAGLTLIFGVMRIINFAHATFAVLAMYFPAFWFLEWWGVDPFLSSIIALPIFFLLGYGLQRFLLERVIAGPNAMSSLLIMTMGFSMVIENLILIGWSGYPRIINKPYTLATWKLGNILVNQAQTYSLFISLALILGLYLLLNRTMVGKGIRAVSDDPEGCAYVGINVRELYGIAFGVGIAITAAGGCLMATYRPFGPFFAQTIIIILFASVVLGGLGSISGALIGGIIISLIQQLSTLFVSVSLQNVAVFIVFVLFLYVRPQGLLGKRMREV